MLIIRLAFRNIIGAGLRTWLNVAVLSIAFVAIIWSQGYIDGMQKHGMELSIQYEIAGGQFWHRSYNKYDPLTINESHSPLSEPIRKMVEEGKATPILIASAAMFPNGRLQSVILKGIDERQKIIGIPSDKLIVEDDSVIPAMIGEMMAEQTNLKAGDYLTIRWRDANGTFDATDIKIVHIMPSLIQSVDAGQIWLPLERLREMLQMPGEATIVVVGQDVRTLPPDDENWVFRDRNYLLKDIITMVKAKSASSSVLYILLLSMGLLAIFDTQVLSIFKRRKEIGTMVALGMTRRQVIGLFTFEGALHGVMALLVGAVYGIPLLMYSASRGMSLGEMSKQVGSFNLPETLYPSYGMPLVAGTTLLVLIAVTIVSFLPTRRISKLKPTDALRGK